MEKSSPNLSYGSAVGADQDRPVETDTTHSGSPKIDSLVGEGAALPPEAQAFIAQCEPGLAKRCYDGAVRILQNEKRSNAGRIDNGLELIMRKSELRHGRFEAYVEALEIPKKHAERCMSVGRHFGPHRDLVSGVAWSALYDLTAKEVSQEVRDEVITRLKAGEHLAPKDIQSLIGKASRATSGPVTPKADRSGLPKTSPSPSEERPDPPTAVPDRSRAVALLARSDSSVPGKANELAVTMSDVQPPIDRRPNVARPMARAVQLLSAPQTATVSSQEQVDVPAVIHEDLPALAALVQPGSAVADNLIEEATSTSGPHVSGDQASGTDSSSVKMAGVLFVKLTREEGRELYLCMKRKGGELMHLLGERYGIVETDAHVTDDEASDGADVG